MLHLEHPAEADWNARRDWFEQLVHDQLDSAGYLLSEQACALTADVQCTFCAGAWVAVVVLAAAVIEAQLRECEVPDCKGNAQHLMKAAGLDDRFDKLRKRRNQLTHVGRLPAITVDQQWSMRDKLEDEAREAVQLMFEALSLSPCL